MVALGALLLLPSVLSLLGTWAFVGRMAWITNDEAIPRQKAGNALHWVARAFRWIGWIIVVIQLILQTEVVSINLHAERFDPNIGRNARPKRLNQLG